MPVVTVCERLNSSQAAIWKQLCDVESYPEYMESIVDIKIVSRKTLPDNSIETVVSWEATVKGSILRWTERELRYDHAYRLTFEQVSGDLEVYRGYWEVRAIDDDSAEATLEVEFQIGVAELHPMLEPLVIQAIRTNSTDMLRALGSRASSAL
ncbi:SRPBCC family protein [Nocardia ninae]|uniref:Cyclase n=1 Tax=Nocardia ninae NBRC 108245 TaxID=1210091 RepID=A0A511MD61_9NOCA|nr:SRPBCC family protein [Nocardia ninae]GEM38519.1 cyclase [Nocardia ninae NBRC 108245]